MRDAGGARQARSAWRGPCPPLGPRASDQFIPACRPWPVAPASHAYRLVGCSKLPDRRASRPVPIAARDNPAAEPEGLPDFAVRLAAPDLSPWIAGNTGVPGFWRFDAAAAGLQCW